jgi:hypothetical protein
MLFLSDHNQNWNGPQMLAKLPGMPWNYYMCAEEQTVSDKTDRLWGFSQPFFAVSANPPIQGSQYVSQRLRKIRIKVKLALCLTN